MTYYGERNSDGVTGLVVSAQMSLANAVVAKRAEEKFLAV